MGELFDTLKGFFDKAGWPTAIVEGEPILSLTYQGSNGQWVFIATVDEQHMVLTVFSRAPIACPPDRMAAMCELIVRANFGMSHGCFDMDHDDGELRYRTGTDLAGLSLTAGFLQAIVNYNLMTMNTYLPALQAVIDGRQPAEALDEVMSTFD